MCHRTNYEASKQNVACDTPLSQFTGQRYLALETFRRNGKGVKTTVWFAEDAGKLYIWTFASSGKIRRMRANSTVRLCPSSVRGAPKGTWIEARSRVLDQNESVRPRELISKKYGVQFWLLDHLNRGGRVLVELSPSP